MSKPAELFRGRRHVRPTCEALEAREVLSGVTATYVVTSNWGSGFQAGLKLDNGQTTPVADWVLEFDYTPSISSVWNAQIVSHTGTHYVVRGASWDSTLPAKGAVDFGFIGGPGANPVDPKTPPKNYLLNGAPLDGPTPPALSVGDATATEPAKGSAPVAFTVSLSSPSIVPITVNYGTADVSARVGLDYTAASGTLTFAPGQTSQSVSVAVLADNLAESDETFRLVLSGPAGATLAKSAGTATIHDYMPPASGDVTYAVTSDWGSGFNAQVALKNSSDTAWTSWTLEFDYGGSISSLWDARMVSHVGNHYVVTNASYNGAVAPGATVSLGFTASPGGAPAAPSNFTIRGVSLVNHAPTAVSDSAQTAPGTPVIIPVLANDTDPDGDPITLLSVTPALHGALVMNPTGTVTYTPAAGYTGPDAFNYTISDGRGGTAGAAVSLNVSAQSWPAHVFAPYVDMGLYPTFDITSAARTQGVKYFNLGFVVADSSAKPSWGGYDSYEISGTAFDTNLRAQVNALRGLGGDVAVSFGGASGLELAQAITDVNALKSAYQSVVDAYGLTRLDFDIEGSAAADRPSVDRRSQALAALQQTAAAAGKPLQVWLTLPVLPTGLTADGLYVVQSARRYGVNITGVNVMAMDYGDSAAPDPSGHMGDYAIQAATSTFNQLKTLYGASKSDAQLWGMIGVTPMIGLNDVTTETFDQAAARQLLAFAGQKGIGQIAFWSLNRDRPDPRGAVNYVELDASSIVQTPYEFSNIFKPFTS